jgi:hypothetical protein
MVGITKLQPWHRQENENDEQWELFQIYLRERSNIAVAQTVMAGQSEQKVQVFVTHVSRVKHDKKWDARVKAYDRWLNKQKDDAIKEIVKRGIIAHGNATVTTLRRVDRLLNKVLKKIEDDKELPTLYAIDQLMTITRKMSSTWKDLKEINPEQLEEVAKPFENEMNEAQKKLMDFVKKQRETTPHQTEVVPSSEILQ